MNALKAGTLVLLLSFACCHTKAARGQSAAKYSKDPPIQLRASQHFGSQALVCNGVSNLVIERDSFLAQLIGGAHLATTVHRISLDASSDTQFNILSIVRPNELADRTPDIWAFTSSPSGQVFVLTRWLKSHVSEITNILRFDSQGTLEGITPLEIENIQVLHMARFRDGKYILIAGKMGEAGVNSVDVIIFAEDGKLLARKPLRKLSETEVDVAKKQQQRVYEEMLAKSSTQTNPSQDKKKEDGSDSQLPEAKQPGQEMFALATHTILTYDDYGTVYMLRPDKPGVIYRVTGAVMGDVEMTAIPLEKKVSADLTGGAEYTQLINATISGGQLILFYSKFDAAPSMTRPYHVVSTFIKTYNLLDGEPIGTYIGDAVANGMIPAGWSKEGPSYLRYSKSIQPPGVEIVFSSR